jgi:hypothetical protein
VNGGWGELGYPGLGGVISFVGDGYPSPVTAPVVGFV